MFENQNLKIEEKKSTGEHPIIAISPYDKIITKYHEDVLDCVVQLNRLIDNIYAVTGMLKGYDDSSEETEFKAPSDPMDAVTGSSLGQNLTQIKILIGDANDGMVRLMSALGYPLDLM